LFYQSKLRREAIDALIEIAKVTGLHGITAVVGLPVEVNSKLYNCAALLSNGEIIGIVTKTYLRDDGKLFEFLILEGMQAGLSWRTVLYKRENYRRAFDGFDPEKIARYGAAKTRKLLQDAGIIRNRLKVAAAISNAQAFLDVRSKEKSFSKYIWQFTDGKPIVNRWKTMKEIPATSPESDRMSKTLRERGFRFVGSTICYAHMQATGMVNDHLVSCHRHAACRKL
jgi:DNA-3-methyladenine glycosylase I